MKVNLTLSQAKFTEGIPEIESLIRTYTVIDNILLKFKVEEKDIDTLNELVNDVSGLVSDLYSILREIEHFKTAQTVEIVKKFKNPELNTIAFNTFMDCYKNTKRVLDTYEMTDLQQKVFRNIDRAVKLVLKYRNGKYYIPKVTDIIISQVTSVRR